MNPGDTTTAIGTPERRADIQSLRAFAVVAVLLFHVDLPAIAGGYLGVDIFFVISGYLITRILYFDLAAGRIRFRDFYARRVRRLLPAAAATVLATLVAATFLFSSIDLEAAAESGAYALASASNILFWLQSGYFDAASDLKPLLHTWSLGVEEQVYLLAPALVVLVARLGRRATVAAIAILGLLSVAGAQWLLADHAAATFYLTPFRLFEFSLGAVLCFVPRLAPGRTALALYLAAGLAMTVSVVLLGPADPMPGLLSLVPAGAAALCIFAGAGAPALVTRREVTWIGDISYSLYLVHWPLVVFWKYRFGPDIPAYGQAALVAASFALGWLLHRFVERPLRPASAWRNWRRVTAGSLGYLAALAFAVTAWLAGGFAWRMQGDVKIATSGIGILEAARSQSVAAAREAYKTNPNGPRVLIIGDSHGQDLLNALYANGATNLHTLDIAYRCQIVTGPRPLEGGPPDLNITTQEIADTCTRQADRLPRHPEVALADTIVLAARWKDWAAPRIGETVAHFRAVTDAPILVFGPQAEFVPAVPVILQNYGALAGADQAARAREDLRRHAVNDEMRELVAAAGGVYVDKFALLCGAGPCPVIVPGTESLFIFDYGHWTNAGAAYFGALLKRLPVASELFPSAQN